MCGFDAPSEMFQAAGPDLTRVIERTGCGLGSPALSKRLREVNRAIEETASGGFRTEFFPTYDLKVVAEQLHIKAQ